MSNIAGPLSVSHWPRGLMPSQKGHESPSLVPCLNGLLRKQRMCVSERGCGVLSGGGLCCVRPRACFGPRVCGWGCGLGSPSLCVFTSARGSAEHEPPSISFYDFIPGLGGEAVADVPAAARDQRRRGALQPTSDAAAAAEQTSRVGFACPRRMPV